MQARQFGFVPWQFAGFLEHAAKGFLEFLDEAGEFLGFVGVGGFQPEVGKWSFQRVDRSQQRRDAVADRQVGQQRQGEQQLAREDQPVPAAQISAAHSLSKPARQ